MKYYWLKEKCTCNQEICNPLEIKMLNKKRNIIQRLGKPVILIIVFLFFIAWLDPYKDEVSKGNTRYQDEKFHAAKRYYKKAEKYAPSDRDKMELSFNKGDADYKTGDYDSAIANFEMAIKSGNKDIQKKAFYNLGNTYTKMGKYKEAVGAYINALKIDPGYNKAKKNIEYLLNKKKNEDKDKKKNKDKNKDGKNKNKQKQQDKQNEQNKNRNNKQPPRLNKSQVKNLLDTMKRSKVRRQKGSGNYDRNLQKQW